MASDPNRSGIRRSAAQPPLRAPSGPALAALPTRAVRWIRHSPTRTLLAVALGGSILFLLYGLLARDATQIPTLCAGAAVFGLVFAALGVGGALEAVHSARTGHAALAFGYALGGGVAAIVSAVAFGIALVLAMVWGAA